MAKRKTRIVREGRNKGGMDTAPVSVSRIDLEQVKARYAGKALPEEDEYFEEYDEQNEYWENGQAHSRVADSNRELNIFGEGEENAPKENRRFTLAFFAALLISSLIGLYFLLIVDTIKVGGNNALEKGEVLTIAGLNPGEHLWFADIGGAKARLLNDPMIKDATVKRVYPDTISIVITERKAVAAIVSGGTVAVIDEEGCVMEISSQVPQNMLEIYGVSSAGFTAGQDLSKDSMFNAEAMIEILTALTNYDILGIIDYIDMSQPLRIEMNTVYGIHVNVGQAENISEKLSNLSKVISKVMTMGYQGGTIDLAVLGDPVYAPPSAEPVDTPEPVSPENTDTMLPGQDPDDPSSEPSPSPVPAATPQTSAGGNAGQHGFSG